MKCIYSSLRPPIEQKCSYADWITNCDQILSVSSKSLVAFTSSFCLNQQLPKSVSYHVYVADLNRPHQPYLLQESPYNISILEWDPSGTKLLTCDTDGTITIYTSKDFLISEWKVAFKQSFTAETFTSACWYHPGIVSTINVANQNLKTSSNHLEYTDKIQQSKFNASLRLFGGKAAEGCILISRTGLICCLTLMADGTLDIISESLAPLRTRIQVSDISYHRDGSFIIGTSSGLINATIIFYKISLAIKKWTIDDVDPPSGPESNRVQISCKQYHSFHLNVVSQILSERENNSVTFEQVKQIKFVSKDSPDDVIIEISGQNLSLIELWELETRRRSPVHVAILELKQHTTATNSVLGKIKIEEDETLNSQQQQQEPPVTAMNKQPQQPDGPNRQVREWTFKGNYINTEKELRAIQVPKFKIFGTNRQLNIILLAYKDSTICCLRKEDLQPVGDILDLSYDATMSLRHPNTRHFSSTGQELDPKASYKLYSQGSVTNRGGNGASAVKSVNSSSINANHLSKRGTIITDLELSANQTLFVAIDSMSQLHAVQLSPLIVCQDSKDQETYLQYMLEYCLVTGNDWWDVLVCIGRDSIEPICDKFLDAYERQPKHIQRKYFNRHLMIRASLYRCLDNPASLCKSSDCHTMIMLNSISSTLKSMLRSQDQDNPAEQLSNFLKSQGMQASYLICNNVISKINEKEFYVEANLIQCLQPLNQWVVDFAIFLIASLPQRVKTKSQLAGAGLGRNKEALEILRELLIIIKIWGKLNPVCLPVIYQLNDQIDAIGVLYQLISIYYTSGNNETEQFLADCAQFANNITVNQFEYFLQATGVASPTLHNRQQQMRQLGGAGSRLLLEYFQEPTAPELAPLDKVEGSINLNGLSKMDVVRNISLGAYPLTNVRHCTRCCAVSLMRPSFNTTRVWEQRWMTTCVCGGHWAQSDRMCSRKMSSLALLYHSSSIGTLNQLASQLVR